MSARAPLTVGTFLVAAVLAMPSAGRPADDPPKAPRPDAVPKDLAPRPVTIRGDKIKLSDALKQLAEQTDIAVEDRRRKAEGDDPELKLGLKAVTFWQALDAIAKEADLRVALYQRDGKIALVDGPHVQLPTSYSGIFRLTCRRMTSVHDLESDARVTVAQVEVAWEPRFRPLLIDPRPQALVAKDDKGKDLPAEDEGGGKVPVEGRVVATTVDLRLPAPPRAAARLGQLKGSMLAVGPSKMLTFEFDTLAKEKFAKEAKQTKEGVTVRLSRIDLAPATHWAVEVTLDYPADGPKFESFQSWVVNNECFLKRAEGAGVFPNNGGYSVDSLGSSKAVLTYNFVDERGKKLVRGKPEDWKLVYRTPGPMAEVPVPFEFKDVPLP